MVFTSIFSFSHNVVYPIRNNKHYLNWAFINLKSTKASVNPFPNDSSKLKEFADDTFKFDENGRKFSKRAENTVGEEVSLYKQFVFYHSVFKRPVLQSHKNKVFFGKGLRGVWKFEVW